jgi:hypothetical protein
MKDPCQHSVGQVAMPAIDTEIAVAEINLRSNSGFGGTAV